MLGFELTQSQKKKLINELLLKIDNLDYRIIKDRSDQKNKIFMKNFKINDEIDAKPILNKISVDNFLSYEFDYDTLKYGPEKVAKFIVECKLVDFNGIEQNVEVYVKIKNKEHNMPVISFHINEY